MIKELFREELQKYISGIILEKNQKLLAIYCMPDHTHVLVSIKPDLNISDFVRDINQIHLYLLNKKVFANPLAGNMALELFLIQNHNI